MQTASSSDRTADIHFPGISVTRAGDILVHLARETLERGYVRMLRRGWYTGMRIIDVDGHDFKVVGARNLGGYGPFWGFSLMFSRRIRIGFELEPQGQRDLEEVKDIISKAMARSPHLWEASEEGLSLWRSKVRGAGSMEEVVEILESSGTATLTEVIPPR